MLYQYSFVTYLFLCGVMDSEELWPILETILVSMVDLGHNLPDFLGSFSLTNIFDPFGGYSNRLPVFTDALVPD